MKKSKESSGLLIMLLVVLAIVFMVLFMCVHADAMPVLSTDTTTMFQCLSQSHTFW